MLKKMTNGVGALLLGAVALLITLVVVLMIRWSSELWSEEAAAWVQAIGSIAAIGVAIWVSHRQHRQERQRDQEREDEEVRNVLLSVRDEIETLWDGFQSTIGTRLEKHPPNEAFMFRWVAPENPFLIYQSHTDKIGKVRDNNLRKMIIHTYSCTAGLLQSLKSNTMFVVEYEDAYYLSEQTKSDVHSNIAKAKLITIQLFSEGLIDDYRHVKDCVETLIAKLNQEEPGL